ncbi:glycerophosphodiester phosphodiesterase [Longimicrobium sp.]|uniref:glycerophosphodiester phosphodiesterase n=1 Tax=Longimicrobium sp. TaxID=2029185 RepID=UPI002CAA8F32|nr:glycerophosphodiester phosphodiesterase family protein [Longimicrobium sp.]HSU14214.1 glycerophosphodiester phosphodiesterase family protein [Longimicrobium sp.]
MRYIAASPDSTADGDAVFANRPLILGHRGAPREAPENTMRAFRRAMEQGADGIELDVQPSADGVPVILHDDTLDRTTDSRGDVADLAWESISAARAGGEPVPRLEEVAAWAAESGAFLNVEIKRRGVEAAALAAIAEAGRTRATLFSSFDVGSVAEVRRLDPSAACWLLTERWSPAVLELARDLGVGGVCLHDPLATPAVLETLRAASLGSVVWTVDKPGRIRALLRAGVAGIITNHPATGIQARAEVEAEGASSTG